MQYFFIVGCPRSGTTVLQQALNRHSRIVIPPETKFFFSFYGQSKKRQVAHLKRIKADLGVNVKAPKRRLNHPGEGRKLFAQIAEAYLDKVDCDNIACFGEKTPEHTGHLHAMRQVFPDAKLVFVYRDGRDVALSLSRMPWMPCNLYAGFVIWLYYYEVLRRECDRPTFDTCFVRYEDLAATPGSVLGRVLKFLGVEFETAVAEGSGNCEGVPPREFPWKAMAIETINARRIGTWRRELPEREVERLERLGHRALTDLGYPLSGGRLSGLTPSFLGALGWGMFRCATGLPFHCIRNECLGSVSRCFSRRGFRSGQRLYPARQGTFRPE